MANVISDETIEYVGILAKLELSDEEKEAAKKDMASTGTRTSTFTRSRKQLKFMHRITKDSK